MPSYTQQPILRDLKEQISDQKIAIREYKENLWTINNELYNQISDEWTSYNEFRFDQKNRRLEIVDRYKDIFNPITREQYLAELKAWKADKRIRIEQKKQETIQFTDEKKILIKNNKMQLKTMYQELTTLKRTFHQQYQALKPDMLLAADAERKAIQKVSPSVHQKVQEITKGYRQASHNNQWLYWKKLLRFQKISRSERLEMLRTKTLLKQNFNEELKTTKAELKQLHQNYRLAIGKEAEFNFGLIIDGANMVAGKIANSRYIASIRSGFYMLMPFVLVGALWLLINNIILNYDSGGLVHLINNNVSAETKNVIDQIKSIGARVYDGCYMIFGLLLCFAVAYHLAKWYKVDQPLVPASVAVAALVVLTPVSTINAISYDYLSTSASFIAMIVAIATTEAYRKLVRVRQIRIKMPAAVPQGVAKPFNVLIPILIILTITGLIALVIYLVGAKIGPLDLGQRNTDGTVVYTTIDSLDTLIKVLIQMPILSFTQGLGGILFIMFFWQLFWFIGIQSSAIISPIVEPLWLDALKQNENGAHNIVTKPFLDGFVMQGGGGTTLALVICIIFVARRKDFKSIAAIALVPGLFNINEPLVFGLPIMLSPIFLLPFIIVPLICVVIAYLATMWNMVDYTTVMSPWTTPFFISSFLNTGGDWRGIILSFINVIIAGVCYLPFVKIADLQYKREQLKTKVMNEQNQQQMKMNRMVN